MSRKIKVLVGALALVACVGVMTAGSDQAEAKPMSTFTVQITAGSNSALDGSLLNDDQWCLFGAKILINGEYDSMLSTTVYDVEWQDSMGYSYDYPHNFQVTNYLSSVPNPEMIMLKVTRKSDPSDFTFGSATITRVASDGVDCEL